LVNSVSNPAPAATVKSETGGHRQRGSSGVGGTRAPKPTLLKWIDVFETGNTEIDSLHRGLVENCNGLLTLLAEDADWPLVLARSKALVADCIEHFRIEESMLEHVKFPRRAAHAAEHRRTEQELLSLLDRMERVDGSLAEHRDLPASLGPSMIDLMIRHDLDYRSHVLHRQGR
jgi:hemerythrin-like metal-binding protein